MPRTAVILLASLFCTPAFADCGERLQSFTTYEDYNDQMERVEGLAITPLMEYSPHSGFEGLVISAEENPKTKVEIELRKSPKGKSLKRETFSFTTGKLKDGSRTTTGLHPAAFFGEEEGFYVVRLLLNGKTLCEDGPREIQPGD